MKSRYIVKDTLSGHYAAVLPCCLGWKVALTAQNSRPNLHVAQIAVGATGMEAA